MKQHEADAAPNTDSETPTPTVFLNGRFVGMADACVQADDRGFLFGDALYESIRVYRGGFFRFGEHWQRLAAGATALKIDAPLQDELHGIAAEVAIRNSVADGTVRVTLTRGPGGEGLRTIGAGPPTLLVSARPISAKRMARGQSGFTAIVAQARRSPVGLPSSIKSANRMDAIMARLEADEAGADEAILLSAEGYVAEGTVSNIFWRSGRRLRTPVLSIGILPGVTRMTILEICAEQGIVVEQGRWPVGELRRAPEVFITMSSLGPVRIVNVDSAPIAESRGGLFDRLREAYWAVVEREAAADPTDSA